jgi:hypothetical protein
VVAVITHGWRNIPVMLILLTTYRLGREAGSLRAKAALLSDEAARLKAVYPASFSPVISAFAREILGSLEKDVSRDDARSQGHLRPFFRNGSTPASQWDGSNRELVN